jgi:hypothetical protein
MTDVLTALEQGTAQDHAAPPLVELASLVGAAADLVGGSGPDSARSLAASGILEAVADRLAAMAEQDDGPGALRWQMLRARDHVESHLIALAHLQAARVSPDNLLGALRRAVGAAEREVGSLAALAGAAPVDRVPPQT